MNHRPNRNRTFLVAALLLPLLMIGCTRQRAAPPEPPPLPPLIAMDVVRRDDRDDVRARFVTFYGAEVLRDNSLDLYDGRVLVPLRSLGETMKKRVAWDARFRRVSIGGAPTLRPITLLGGRSYLTHEQIEEWLSTKVNLRWAPPVFGERGGLVEIVKPR